VSKIPSYRINLRPYRILYFPILLPIAFLLALFNKISPIPFRIYALRVERIGQMAGNQEELLCKLDLGLLPREFRVFIHRDLPSNHVLLDIQKRVLPIKQFFLLLFDVCHKLGGLGVTSLEYTRITGRDEEHLMMRTGGHFSLSEQEQRDGGTEFRGLGLSTDIPFVTVLGRDSAYLNHLGEPTDDNNYRNVDINTFVPALEFLAENHQVVRMGSVVKDALHTDHPNILDYSLSGKRTELLDVYLSARCRFYMTCGSGPDGIAAYNFRIPTLYVNYLPPMYAPPLRAWAMFILKKYWSTSENRYLTLGELLDGDMRTMCTPRELDPLNVTIHDNTPEEILEATQEMTARLDGTWVETEEDRDLQERFWAQYAKRFKGIKYRAKIGSAYLRRNSYWLE